LYWRSWQWGLVLCFLFRWRCQPQDFLFGVRMPFQELALREAVMRNLGGMRRSACFTAQRLESFHARPLPNINVSVMKELKKLLVGIVILSLVTGGTILLRAHEWTIIWCRDAFPGTCAIGGCQARSGWYASSCQIHCTPTLNLSCLHELP